MRHTKILFSITILFFVVLAVGCGKQTMADLEKAAAQAAKSNKKITVPQDLIQCAGKYFKSDDNGRVADCSTFEPDKVCSYYKTIVNGITSVHVLEYNQACLACRFYGETGTKKIDNAEYLHLGYLVGTCPTGK
ncbi:MAG: hypothetical protein WC508_05315 [Patescibacteria group bacterium]